MLQELLLCSTVAMKKELRLLATFAWAAEGAAGAAFRWLLRLRARGRYRAGAGGSPAKRGLIPCFGASSRSREELIIALGSYEQFNGPTSWDQVPTSPPTLPQPPRPGQILRRRRPYPRKGQKLQGLAQDLRAMGGTLHGSRDHPTRCLLTQGLQGQPYHQRMEHQTATSLLPLSSPFNFFSYLPQ